MNRINLILTAFALMVLSTSCTTLAPPAPQDAPVTPAKTSPVVAAQASSWKEHLAAVNRIHAWRLSGKIAIKTAQDSGSASVNWSQSGGQYQVSLMGPFGSHGMTLSGHPGQAQLQTASGKVFRASTPEQLLSKNWGYSLPVSHLKYWVRGIPVQGMTFEGQFDRQNRLIGMQQGGWRIQYLDYMTTANGIALPSKIFINSAALNTKIIIYNWRL